MQRDGFTTVGRGGKSAPDAQTFGARLAAAQPATALSQRARRQRGRAELSQQQPQRGSLLQPQRQQQHVQHLQPLKSGFGPSCHPASFLKSGFGPSCQPVHSKTGFGPSCHPASVRSLASVAICSAGFPGSAPEGLASVARGARSSRPPAGWLPSLPEEARHLACLAATRAALAARRVALGSLQRDLPGGLVGAVALESGVLEAVVDSGAEESVAPPGFCAADMVPSPMSKAGGRYRAANGTRIRNLGQQRVAFTSAEATSV